MSAQILLENVIARLQRHEGNYAEIARRHTAISYSWLTKLAHGQISNPTIQSLQQLIDALDEFEGLAPAGRIGPPPRRPRHRRAPSAKTA